MIAQAEDFVFRFIEKYNMTIFLDKFGHLLLKDFVFLSDLKKKYPKEKDKITLWEKLHGVTEPQLNLTDVSTISSISYVPLSFQVPESKSKLNIHNSITVTSPQPVPTRWQRFWYKKLLGWEWEDLGKKDDKRI